MKSNRGFARSDLLAVLAVVAIAAPILAQATTRDAELNNRLRCAGNLRKIGQACAAYANDNLDRFPMLPFNSSTTYDVTMKPDPGEATRDATLKAMYKQGAYPNNPAANLWVLVIEGLVAPNAFICPGDPFTNTSAAERDSNADPTMQKYYRNFQDEKNLSYSAPFMWTEGPQRRGGRVPPPPPETLVYQAWMNYTDAALPCLSDMAPYLDPKPDVAAAEKAASAAVSQNHLSQGQNVSFNDAHVEFARLPTIGHNNDNIFAINTDPAERGPTDHQIPLGAGKLPHPLRGNLGAMDVVMVPMRDAQGHLK